MSIELFAIGSSGLALAALVIIVITRQDTSIAPGDTQGPGKKDGRDA